MAQRILHVDDEEGWRTVVAEGLGAAGYQVLSAPDASEAMTKADAVNLGLIILDLNLAGESGLILMRFLKHNHPQTPILIYSGLENDDQSVLALLKEGADQYLQKGEIAELIVTVSGYFRRG